MPLQADTSEQIYISSLALLKMLKHGRAGVPLEVMGLMLGEFVDEYTVKARAPPWLPAGSLLFHPMCILMPWHA